MSFQKEVGLNIKTLDILRKDVVYFPEKDRIKLFPLIR